MRDTFVKTLTELAQRDKRVNLITGDLGFGVLTGFWTNYSEQFINAGVAEQNMTGVAVGMALEGKIVFTYSIANFPTIRCLEQIRNDAAYHNANVKIISVGGGFCYGSLGMSHHATEDLALMRALPGIVVTAPGDPTETKAIVNAIYEHDGTCYMRLGRGGEKNVHTGEIQNYKLGKALRIKSGKDVYIFACGSILHEAKSAVEMLSAEGIDAGLVSFPTVKHIDTDMIKSCAMEAEYIFTVEEHNIIGGFGGAVAEVLAGIRNRKAVLCRIGLNDEYSSIVGSQDYLRTHYGMSSKCIADKVIAVFHGHR